MPVRTVLLLLAALFCGVLVYAAAGGSAEKEVSKAAATRPESANTIWSALVLATNVADPKRAPAELEAFAPRLKRVFGYNQFEVIGSASNELGDRAESWLVPSESFWFGLKARRSVSKEARGGYLLSLQLFQNKRPLIDSEVKLAPGSPLFIRGPQYGKGQLIIVLQVQP